MRWTAFFAVALIGLAIRLPQLGARPMHTDEAVNAYIVGQMLAGEPFRYDPRDRHGPALAALALPLARMQGAKSFSDLTESELRLTPVVAGTLTILLFGFAVEMFGILPCIFAALLFAVAPLPAYYDRYFIHESLFCASTFGLILSGWQACGTRSYSYSALAGACAALMFACKETAVLHFLAIALGALLVGVLRRRNRSFVRTLPFAPLVAIAVFIAGVATLFLWFGTNAQGLSALLQAVPDALARAGGQGHQKPAWYYGQLLAGGWSGGLLLVLACVGLIVSVKRRNASPWRFLVCYGFILAAIYSLIPYKTPWLALNLWLPLALFAGRGVASVAGWLNRQWNSHAVVPLLCTLAVAASVLIAHDTRQRIFLHPADDSNPYAYAHTTEDILGLSTEIADLARRDGLATPRIAVIASDPWPLPWYLRHFSQVGFWQPGQQPGDADFYVTSTDAAGLYSDRLRDYRPEFFGVRPNVLILLWSREPK